MRVVAAMSGGVDSAVAAARMLDAGHEVVGVHLALSQIAATLRESARGCCTIEDAGDARRVADMLGHPVLRLGHGRPVPRGRRSRTSSPSTPPGRTPNPCLRCNEKIKFAALLDKALALGFDAVATGHYAQVVEHPDGRRELHRAVDMAKDQSYVLGVLDEDQLARSFFPLGDTTKPQIREEAAERGLLRREQARQPRHLLHRRRRHPRAGWPSRLGEQPGDIVDTDGDGRRRSTRGAYAFTVGQREGCGLDRPAADGDAALRRRGAAADQHRRRRHRRPARRRRPRRRPRPLVRPAARGRRDASAPRCARTARRSPPRPGPTATGSRCACERRSAAWRPASPSCCTTAPASWARPRSAPPRPAAEPPPAPTAAPSGPQVRTAPACPDRATGAFLPVTRPTGRATGAPVADGGR